MGGCRVVTDSGRIPGAQRKCLTISTSLPGAGPYTLKARAGSPAVRECPRQFSLLETNTLHGEKQCLLEVCS
jgi:hypothetical protein